jgi:two-component SAPR family response regulator
VAEEQFVDILWPDADGDLAHKSFEMTVQRLRRLIGSDEVVQLQERRLSLDLSTCWIDVRELEGLIETIDAAWKSGEPSSDGHWLQLSEMALAMYKGHFLPADSSQPWVLSSRERLRSKFLRLIIRLGSHWERNFQWQKAAEVFQKGLEVDGLAEEFYQHLMRCHHEMGQRAEAVSVYNRCRALLLSSLGIPPSRKTEDLYQAIKA